MNKDKLTKEALISVWNRVCKKENNKDRNKKNGPAKSKRSFNKNKFKKK